MAKKDKFIQGAIEHPGALHRSLGIPADQKIPAKRLEKATHSRNALMKKRAVLAETLRSFKHKK